MPDRRREPAEVALDEYQSVELRHDQLSDADLRRLQGLVDGGRLDLRRSPNGWVLKADSTVGVLVLDRIRLVIRPKFAIPGPQLIHWLCYANGIPVPHEATLRHWGTSGSGYDGLVLPALLSECQALLCEGLRRDYVPTDRVEPVLRGRLDVVAQATRRYGAVDRLHVRTFEREVGIWENLICGAALSAAVPLTADPALARALADTAALFPGPRLHATAQRMLTRARYTRLNARYRAAHAWAGLVLGGGGVSDLLIDRGLRADSLLLAMDRLWEVVVGRMVRETATGYRAGRSPLSATAPSPPRATSAGTSSRSARTYF